MSKNRTIAYVAFCIATVSMVGMYMKFVKDIM